MPRGSRRGAPSADAVFGPRPREELLAELGALVAAGKEVVFITGAGLSVASGIAAFRTGEDAVWSQQVTEMGTRRALRKDTLDWYNSFWLPTFEASPTKMPAPSAAHDAIAEMARHRPSVKVVTQNIDGLHVGAIADPQLIEAHGRVGLYRCMRWGSKDQCSPQDAKDEWFETDALSERDRHGIATKQLLQVPECPRCGATLAPLALLFDEMYDAHFFFECDAWDGWFDRADAMVFVGTSFATQLTRDALRRAKERKLPIFNVNVDRPPIHVASARLLLKNSILAGADEALTALRAFVERSNPETSTGAKKRVAQDEEPAAHEEGRSAKISRADSPTPTSATAHH